MLNIHGYSFIFFFNPSSRPVDWLSTILDCSFSGCKSQSRLQRLGLRGPLVPFHHQTRVNIGDYKNQGARIVIHRLAQSSKVLTIRLATDRSK